MHTVQGDFAEAYRGLSNEEIAAIYADIDSLTEEARSALIFEVQQRGLSQAQLGKVHDVELRHEAQFDRLERLRRKKMVLSSLGLDDPKRWIFAIVAFLIIVLIEKLRSLHH